MNPNRQSPSPLAAQPTPDITQVTPSPEAIVPVAPAGAVIDTAQLPDTLYGNTTDMSQPQFYDATAPAVATASASHEATVIAVKATLHIRPDAKSKAVTQVTNGATVRLNNQRRGAWFYVASASGTSGWIHGNDIKLIAADAKPIGAVKPDGEKSGEVKASRPKSLKAADGSTSSDDKANDTNHAAETNSTPQPIPLKKKADAPKPSVQAPAQP